MRISDMLVSTLLVLLFVASFGGSRAAAQTSVVDAHTAAQIASLRDERDAIDLGGPAALTLTSTVVFLGGFIGGVAVLLLDAHICIDSPCSYPPGRLSPALQHGLGGSLMVLGALGLAGIIGGAVWWGRNNHGRRALTREIRELELMPAGSFDADGGWVGISGRF